MKRIISLLVVCMILSSMTMVFAADSFTFTLAGGEYDATAVNVGDYIELPVKVDVLNERTAGLEYNIVFDTNVFEYDSVVASIFKYDREYDELDRRAMRWETNETELASGKLKVFFADTTATPNEGYFGLDPKSMSGLEDSTDVLFKLKLKVKDNSANSTISVGFVEIYDYSTGSQVIYNTNSGNVSAPACTVKFVEASAPAVVTWETATDAGYYTQDETVYGLMRFLFDVATEGVVTETGIKYLKAENIAETIAGAEVSGTSKTFYGDVVAIDEGTTGNYYAAAYAVVDGETRWSAPVSCTPDFVKAVIK